MPNIAPPIGANTHIDNSLDTTLEVGEVPGTAHGTSDSTV